MDYRFTREVQEKIGRPHTSRKANVSTWVWTLREKMTQMPKQAHTECTDGFIYPSITHPSIIHPSPIHHPSSIIHPPSTHPSTIYQCIHPPPTFPLIHHSSKHCPSPTDCYCTIHNPTTIIHHPPSIYPFILLTHLSIHSPLHSSVYLFSIYPSIHLLIYPSTNPTIHS